MMGQISIGAPERAHMQDHDGTVAAGGPRTVLIVDDHQCFADLLSAALSSVKCLRVVGVAASAEAGIALAQELRPSIVVMDIQMPGVDGLLATRRLVAASPGTRVAVVTAHRDGQWIARAAQAGAAAFIPKDGSLAEMMSMLSDLGPGPMRVAPSALGARQTSSRTTAAPARADVADRRPPVELTARERDVLACIARGLQAKAVARVLGISVHTCRGYIKSLYAKLGASTRIEALNRAHELGFVER